MVSTCTVRDECIHFAMGSSSFWGRSYQPAPSPVFWPFYLAHSCAPIIVIILITADSANNNFIWFVLQFWPRFSVLPAPRRLYCSPVILVRFGSNVHGSISLRKFQEKNHFRGFSWVIGSCCLSCFMAGHQSLNTFSGLFVLGLSYLPGSVWYVLVWFLGSSGTDICIQNITYLSVLWEFECQLARHSLIEYLGPITGAIGQAAGESVKAQLIAVGPVTWSAGFGPQPEPLFSPPSLSDSQAGIVWFGMVWYMYI